MGSFEGIDRKLSSSSVNILASDVLERQSLKVSDILSERSIISLKEFVPLKIATSLKC